MVTHAVTALVILLTATAVLGADSPAGTPKPAITQAPALLESTLAQEVSSLRAEVHRIRDELAAAKQKEGKFLGFSTDQWLLVITGFMTVMLVVGAGHSIYFGHREFKMVKTFSESAETRAHETHDLVKRLSDAGEKRSSEMHRISLDSAAVSQSHANAFLTGSERTLALVNETLDLARQATERTVKSAENRLKSEISNRDTDAMALVTEETTHSDRRLVADAHVRDKILALASDLEDVEREIRRLEFDGSSKGSESVQLSPACNFIVGMKHHMEGRWEKALMCWEKAVRSQQCVPKLASRISYWIGYEQNNIGRSGLEEAVASFERALQSAEAEGVRSFELRRLGIESRFFDARRRVDLEHPEQREQLYQLKDGLEKLIAELELKTGQEFRDARRAAATTAGNIRLSVAFWWLDLNVAQSQSEAQKHFEGALEFYSKALEGGDYIWALFGRAQAVEWLKPEGQDAEADYRAVLGRLHQEEFAKRLEPRTKMLSYATEMWCGRGLRAKSVFDNAYDAITHGHASVETPVTIYSHKLKCNVDKQQWRGEVDKMMTATRASKTEWVAEDARV